MSAAAQAVVLAALALTTFGAVLEKDTERWISTSTSAGDDISSRHPVGLLEDPATVPKAVSSLQESIDVENRLGLQSVGNAPKKKTVLLIDGEASRTETFRVVLNTAEFLRSVVHTVNDSTIITTHSKHVQQITANPTAAYNITLTHDFEGTVGVSTFLLTVITTRTKYITFGRYYVSGIVAKTAAKNMSERIVSGMASSGLSFKTPDSVTLNSSYTGQLPLSIDYQQVGPDVSEKMMSLREVMLSAQVSIKQSESDELRPLMEYTSSECKSIQIVRKDNSGIFVFPKQNCGVGLDDVSGLLVLNLNREISGSAVIMISIPALVVDGEEFETSINVFVGKQGSPKPVVEVGRDLEIVLDHFGSEVVEVNMYNTIKPAQMRNATNYLMDLPGKRYAEVDFGSSRLLNPIQVIRFKTLKLGAEDPEVWKLIQMSLSGTEPLPSPEQEMDLQIQLTPEPDIRTAQKVVDISSDIELWSDNVVRAEIILQEGRDHSLFPQDSSLKTLVERATEDYASKVHVLFPPNKFLTTAVSNSHNPIRTSFASDMLAKTTPVETDPKKKYVKVSFLLADYSVDTFSEHKNQQIRDSLEKQAKSFEEGKNASVKLTTLKNKEESVIATYTIETAGNSSVLASKLSKDQALPSNIAKDARLASSRISDVSVRAVTSTGGEANVNGDEGTTTLNALPINTIVFAVVVLSFIIAIPMFAFCFGYVVSRRHRQQRDASDLTSADTTGAAADASSIVPNTSVDGSVSPAPARDTFGRAEVTDNSFKMERELFKDGYYGDNPGSSRHTGE